MRVTGIPDRRRLQAIQLAGDFYSFVAASWWVADNTIFVDEPYIRVVCDELQRAVEKRHQGESVDLAIALPPGASKSMLVSVLLLPWVWTWWPDCRMITAAYDDPLAHRLSIKSRRLVDSGWYQSRWPIKLRKIAGGYWDNAYGGCRIAVGIGSRITGEHGHIIALDDPVKEQLTRIGTPAQVAQAVGKSTGYWFGTLSTRVVDYKAACLLCHQRLHIDDPIGVAGRGYGYRVIKFPARYVAHDADKLDSRTVEGELLCSRMTEDILRDLELRLGPRAAAAQLQQAPVPLGGALLTDDYLSHRYSILPSDLLSTVERGISGPEETWITAWDFTFKGKPTSDYVVGQVWCSYHGRHYLIDQVRAQAGFRESKRMVTDLAARYPFITEHDIEDAANAAAIEEDLRDEIAGICLTPHGGGVLARTQQVEGLWASGAIMLPADAPWMGGADGFVAEHLSFDGLGTRHDDQVSASSLGLLRLHSKGGSGAWIRAMKEAAQSW